MTTWNFAPRPAGFNSPTKRREFDETAALLLDRAFDVCRYLLPAGKRVGDEYEIGSTNGEKGRSMKINLKKGIWQDFSEGKGGADLIALWAAVEGVRMVEAKIAAETWLGLNPVQREAPKPFSGKVVAGPGWTEPPKDTPEPAPSPPKDKPDDEPGWWKDPDRALTTVYTYVTPDGEIFGEVHRIDDKLGRQRKMVRQWNPTGGPDGRGEFKSPPGARPLYNAHLVAKSPRQTTIILVEGEKTADALNALQRPDFIATTTWGGANAVRKTDFSPLKGREILRWGDNDHPVPGRTTGRERWDAGTQEKLKEAGAAVVRDIPLDLDRPDGWDAADATKDEILRLIGIGLGSPPVYEDPKAKEVRARDLFADVNHYGQPIEPHRWLVDKVFPFGRAGIFAAAGDTGKGMLMLDLAVKVATPRIGPRPVFLGHEVVEHGRAVILSAEDDNMELRRRLFSLHPHVTRETLSNLVLYPFPDHPLKERIYATEKDRVIVSTDAFESMLVELSEIDNLKLVVVDTIGAFTSVDLTTALAGQRVGAMLDNMATRLGCTVIGSHHLTKGDRRAPVRTLPDARHAIAGSGQLLNSLRFAYSIFLPEEKQQEKMARLLGKEWKEASLYLGGVVKANGPSDRSMAVFWRNEKTGLLEYQDNEIIRASAARQAAVAASRGLQNLEFMVKTWNDLGTPCTRLGKYTGIVHGSQTAASGALAVCTEYWRKLTAAEQKAIIDRAIVLGSIVELPDKIGNKKQTPWLCMKDDGFALGTATHNGGARIALSEPGHIGVAFKNTPDEPSHDPVEEAEDNDV